jgi:hypothetical protein
VQAQVEQGIRAGLTSPLRMLLQVYALLMRVPGIGIANENNTGEVAQASSAAGWTRPVWLAMLQWHADRCVGQAGTTAVQPVIAPADAHLHMLSCPMQLHTL